MSEEIKELLDILNKVKDYDDKRYFISCGENDYLLDNDEIKCLLNYITNLQKENKQLKKSRDFHLRFNQSLMRRVDFYQSRNEKGLNKLITLIQIIGEQPSKNVEEDNWLLSKLESIQIELQGGDE